MKTLFYFFISITLYTLASRSISANCGLQLCPLHFEKKANWELGLNQQVTRFDIGGRGAYQMTSLIVNYHSENFRVGVSQPFALIQSPTFDGFTIANTMTFGELILLQGDHYLALGSQLELPTGKASTGAAAEHFMLIPYLTYMFHANLGTIAVQAGINKSLTEHAHGGADILYIYPHSGFEALSRFTLAKTFGIFSPLVQLDLRQVLDDHATGDKTFFNGGVGARIKHLPSQEITLRFEFPLMSNQRELWQLMAMWRYFI